MFRSIIALASAGLLLSSCGTPAVIGGGTTPPADIVGTWELEAGLQDGDPIPHHPRFPITLTLESDRIAGTAACNGYGGSYEASGGRITFGDISMTEMACDGAMDSEAAYMRALVLVNGYALTDDALTLTGPGIELTFTLLPPVPIADLVGTVWVLDGLIEGDAVSSVGGEEATLELFSDGSLIGSTGCRTLTGSYVVNGTSVEFTDFAATGECPAALEDQDNHVVTVLGDGFQVEIDGDRMFVTATGHQGVTYKARA